MAKKDKEKKGGASASATSDKIIKVSDLVEEYKVCPKKLRALIRAQGFKAPAADTPAGTFGPKARYEWPADSPDLTKIRTAIKENRADLEPTEPKKRNKKDKE